MSESIPSWHCSCGAWNSIGSAACNKCEEQRPPANAIHFEDIEANSWLGLELLERHKPSVPKPLKQASRGISEGSKRPTTKELYKRVNWGAFTDNEIMFTVYGKPIAKERPRLGRKVKGKQTTYTPTKTKDYEKLVNQTSKAAMHGIKPLAGLLRLSVTIFRADGIRADIDNILKSIMDGMEGAVYFNDSQVAELDSVRVIRYASTECVSITVREFAQYPIEKKARTPRLEKRTIAA